MDLFRRHVWVGANSMAGVHANGNGTREKDRGFYDSLTSQDSTWQEGTDDSSSKSKDLPPSSTVAVEDDHVRSLERQLQERNQTVSQLRQDLVAEDERTTHLEYQLGRLVELSSRQRAKEEASTKTSQLQDGNITQEHMKDKMEIAALQELLAFSSQSDETKLEIATLQELLARVIAEKDRLWNESNSLRTLVKQLNRDKDKGKHKKESTTKGREQRKRDQIKQKSEIEEPPVSFISKDQTAQEEESDMSKERPQSTLFQMSCRKCCSKHCYTQFLPSDNTTDGASAEETTKVLKMHYSQVWKIVQELQADCGCISFDSKEEDQRFIASPLARHLAKHCQLLQSERAVIRWCKKNVKVEGVC